MRTVLAISSFVARGTVGLRAIQPALDRLGVRTVACPTVVLSNHLGYPRTEGTPIAAETLAAMFDAIEANGWLENVDAVLTGYLPSPAHVHAVEALIARVAILRPDALIVCDPVLGDDPEGLYVPAAVAEAVRDALVPRATHLKANRFELAYLAGRPVETPEDAVRAAHALAPPVVLASSLPVTGDRLANVIATPTRAARCTVARESGVPHGTGDLLAALFTAHALAGGDPLHHAAAAVAGVARVIAQSLGCDELSLAGQALWQAATPLPVELLAC